MVRDVCFYDGLILTLIKRCWECVPDDGRRQQTAETPAFRSCSAAGETDASDSSFPRLRRGRRRTDEARLDLWGFATPSPPTPPVPTPPSSPPPALNSAQPARRPRGRPRSTPLPERASRGKERAASEAETPAHLKRQRCRSRKYQTGEYITEKAEESDPLRQHSETPAGRQLFLQFPQSGFHSTGQISTQIAVVCWTYAPVDY